MTTKYEVDHLLSAIDNIFVVENAWIDIAHGETQDEAERK